MLENRNQDNPMAYIYALEFPEGCIRYIGKTMDPEMRYRKHLRDAKYSTKSHRLAWINSLLKQGQKPIFSIIDIVPENEWAFWEKHYISLYSSWGFDLTNGTLGGEGVVATMEVKQRISISCKKYWSCHDNWIRGKQVLWKHHKLVVRKVLNYLMSWCKSIVLILLNTMKIMKFGIKERCLENQICLIRRNQ